MDVTPFLLVVLISIILALISLFLIKKNKELQAVILDLKLLDARQLLAKEELITKYEEKLKSSKAMSYDAQALLTDLLAGAALVRIERLAPTDYLLKSPRG